MRSGRITSPTTETHDTESLRNNYLLTQEAQRIKNTRIKTTIAVYSVTASFFLLLDLALAVPSAVDVTSSESLAMSGPASSL